MSEPAVSFAETEAPLAALVLHPVHGDEKDAFTVSLEQDVMSLISPDERLVLMLPREEAARHIRFNYDVFHGRTVSFVIVEGLKAHTFKCPLLELEQLLNWLPQKPREEQEREVRRYGVAIVLLGAGLLLFPQYFFWVWGLALVFLGLADIWWSRDMFYGVNAAAMFVASLVLLFAPVPLGLRSGADLETARLLATGLGSLLIIWSVQQASLLGPIHRLRLARAHRDARNARERAPSSAVKAIAWTVGALGVFFLAHLGWLGMQARAGAGEGLIEDWILHGVVSGTLLLLAGSMWVRGFRSYVEAKLAAQFALMLAVFYAAGAGTMLWSAEALGPQVLRMGFLAWSQVYVWAPLVVLVVVFNRWLAGRVERELEENRG
ncbi:MAG: hypothetical protein KA184_09245 [Candidatus Hydrogenedentes bacterium]|nr:hypothetical protein [Candidatus Hydrogenedentota bacterium]